MTPGGLDDLAWKSRGPSPDPPRLRSHAETRLWWSPVMPLCRAACSRTALASTP
jgi:hypothetical protein